MTDTSTAVRRVIVHGVEAAVPYADHHHDQLLQVLDATFAQLALIGIEIGTNAGDSARALLERRQMTTLFTIDPWRHQPGEGFEAGEGQPRHDEREASARRKLQSFGHKVRILKMTSDEAFEVLRLVRPADRSGFDFVWIDGHHAEAQVRKDIVNYWSLVRPGGILGGHDYGLVAGVTRVVDAFMAGKTWATGGDFTWWTRKPPDVTQVYR